MKDLNDDRMLLVLDLDETLIHATETKLDDNYNFEVGKYFVYIRPGLTEFIFEMNKHFRIGIWSSASDDYVEEVVRKIIPRTVYIEFVWGRTRCSYRRNLKLIREEGLRYDHSNHYNFVKPLKKLKKHGFSLKRILIVDDSPHKCQDNYGNAIYPAEFKGDRHDQELYCLSIYLRRLKDKENIRRIEKRNWKESIMN